MKLENGKTYLVNHSRKGTFAMRVNSQCETWVHCVVTGGTAKAFLTYNEAHKGDEIGLRISHLLSAVEQPE